MRVTDPKVLSAAMEPVAKVRAPGAVNGTGAIFAINANADPELATLRYRLKNASIDAAEESFTAAGHTFNRGSFIITMRAHRICKTRTSELDFRHTRSTPLQL